MLREVKKPDQFGENLHFWTYLIQIQESLELVFYEVHVEDRSWECIWSGSAVRPGVCENSSICVDQAVIAAEASYGSDPRPDAGGSTVRGNTHRTFKKLKDTLSRCK